MTTTRWDRMKGRVREARANLNAWLDETSEDTPAAPTLTREEVRDKQLVASLTEVMRVPAQADRRTRKDRQRERNRKNHTPPDWIKPEHEGRTRAGSGTKATKDGPTGPAAARARRRAAARREANRRRVESSPLPHQDDDHL